MQIAIVDKNNIITNVVIFDEPDFKEDDTHKYLTPGLWIGDTYSVEIPQSVLDEQAAQDMIEKLYANVPKIDLVTQIASLREELDTLKEYVNEFMEESGKA